MPASSVTTWRVLRRGRHLPGDSVADVARLRAAFCDQLAAAGLLRPAAVSLILDGRLSGKPGATCDDRGQRRYQVRVITGPSTDVLELRHMLAHELGHLVAWLGGARSDGSFGTTLAAEYVAERTAWGLLQAAFGSELGDVAAWEADHAAFVPTHFARAERALRENLPGYADRIYLLARSAMYRQAYLDAHGRPERAAAVLPPAVAAAVESTLAPVFAPVAGAADILRLTRAEITDELGRALRQFGNVTLPEVLEQVAATA